MLAETVAQQQCEQGGHMRYDITVGSISWINGEPSPISFSPRALFNTYDWVPKTYTGLVATANQAPPNPVDFDAHRKTNDFRAMAYCRFNVEIDDSTDKVVSFKVINAVHDPGWTPPFNKMAYPSTYLAVWQDFPSAASPGEASPLSLVNTQARHANSTMTSTGPGETVLVNGLIKFRAGSHTDKIGIDIGCPFHVPWVWCETLLTYKGGGGFSLYGRASLFPTHHWFVNGSREMTQDQTWDNPLPWSIPDPKLLKIYPIVSKGAPASGSQTSLSSETHAGAVDTHPNTVAGDKVSFRPLRIKGGR
jgi:hypothetical protein